MDSNGPLEEETLMMQGKGRDLAVVKACSAVLTHLPAGSPQVTDQSVKAFAEHCPELQYVGFMGCSVTSKGVIHLTKLRNLSSLDLRHITELDNETVMEIVKRCKNLSSLNLCLNWIINDRCVEVIAKEGQNLKELYLVSCKITDYAYQDRLGLPLKTSMEDNSSLRTGSVNVLRLQEKQRSQRSESKKESRAVRKH
ncbi:F-box/LRR-repeat protein 17 isoform X2 [Odocoileus virginianus]|uniref:F-box/LRR-repeat protein 17 isoform X2 n=1 Tax=Odocoileus virginianus TaxID=9874 RepID=A0ABM4HTC5_ODOVR